MRLQFADFEISEKQLKNDHRKTAIVLRRGLGECRKGSKIEAMRDNLFKIKFSRDGTFAWAAAA